MTNPSSTAWIWPHLGKRLPTLKTAVGLLRGKPAIKVLELGTTRSFRAGVINTTDFNPDPTTWDWGAGCFTYACLRLLPGAQVTSIDISREALNVCERLCKDDRSRLQTEAIDSSTFLSRTQDTFDLIYMDHAEADDSDQVALLHLQDAKIIISRSVLNPEGLLLIDDVAMPAGQISKGLYSIPFLTSAGFSALSHNSYQALLRDDRRPAQQRRPEPWSAL